MEWYFALVLLLGTVCTAMFLGLPVAFAFFAANILELLGNPAVAQRMGENARWRVEEAWLWPSLFPRIMQIYDELR